jgi:hypothetical protein
MNKRGNYSMDTVTVETSKLIGPALDWAVAKCEGEDYIAESGVNGIGIEYEATNYSANWSQGGPIIEREMSKVFRNVGGTWSAMILKDVPLTPEEQGTSLALSRREQWNGSGPTPLIAAMRCYVASNLGDTVQIPRELVP